MTVKADLEKQRNDLLFVLYNNMAMCNLQQEEYKKTIALCQKARDLPPGTNGNICKVLYRYESEKYAHKSEV